MTFYKNEIDDELDFGKLASVFFLFGILSLLMSWYYSADAEVLYQENIGLNRDSPEVIVGPIKVAKKNTAHEIAVSANLSVNSWTFLEGEVLDQQREYLFSFGKELWYETGYDSDGSWSEAENNYELDVTFPDVGTYFLKFKYDSIRSPNSVFVKVARSNGSALPHFWFGIITILIGVVLNEFKNRTIRRMFGD